jgi:hypothetical protein
VRKAGYFLILLAGALGAGASVNLVHASSPSKATSSSAPVVSPEAGQNAGLSPQELSVASKLYINKCIRCHKSYEPKAYSNDQWDLWMGKMSKKAHLASAQESLLRRYLAAYRAGESPAATNRVIAHCENPALAGNQQR